MNYQLDVKFSPELELYRSAIEATLEPYIQIKLTDNSNPTWWQSKFGGLPYLPKGFEYPKSEAGEYLYLLAQINFTEVPEITKLPEKGILQFYLANDNMYGCDLNNLTKQDRFRVIYFPEVSLSEEDLVTDFSFLSPQKEYNLPLEGCSKIEFAIDCAPITVSDYKFDIFGDDVSDALYDEYWDKAKHGGHQLLGYPYFTQEDPRGYLFADEQYDRDPYILLLQIDSENHKHLKIMWGDMGIANFFIRESDLIKLNFANVLYNWDCT